MMSSTTYHVIGSRGEEDRKSVERLDASMARKAANAMLDEGYDVRVIKVVKSLYGEREAGGRF
jgi:hypothetical protein